VYESNGADGSRNWRSQQINLKQNEQERPKNNGTGVNPKALAQPVYIRGLVLISPALNVDKERHNNTKRHERVDGTKHCPGVYKLPRTIGQSPPLALELLAFVPS
jgi:hypothetical protein